jgi:F0F1-type ATP synthase assembly protein I
MAKVELSKADKKAARTAKRAASKERRGQFWQAFQMQRKDDKALIPILVGTVVASAVVFFVVGLFFGAQWYSLPLGVVVGVLLGVIIFGRRLQRSVYSKADGQPGAAGWALENMRGSWRVTQAVAGNTQLDAVHRVLGRPGVILVAEGAPTRVKGLLAQEKKKVARLVGDTPIYDVVVGNEEGQVTLAKLQRHLTKLPRNIDSKRMDSLDSRLAAISSRSGGAAMPKGPVPAGAKTRSVQRSVKRR